MKTDSQQLFDEAERCREVAQRLRNYGEDDRADSRLREAVVLEIQARAAR